MTARSSRGQSLVLFCIGLLLLTLMVLLTLSISAKVKDRIELQTTADAAAYSEAVVMARAFNAVSLLNRAQVSHMVALSAVQSLISWSGYAKATLAGTEQALNSMRSDCTCDARGCRGPNCGCSDGDINAALSRLAAHRAVIQASWQRLDGAAGSQQRLLQNIAGGRTFSAQRAIFLDYARSRIEGRDGAESLAEAIVRDARKGSPWRDEPRELYVDKRVMAAGGYPTQQELTRAVANYGRGGVFDLARTNSMYSVYATMGSRLDGFVTHREGGGAALSSMVTRLIGPAGFSGAVTNLGSGYFSSGRTMAHGSKGQSGGGYGWGDDHDGTVTVTRSQGAPCKTSGTSGGMTAHMYGSDLHLTDDRHVWQPFWNGDTIQPDVRHTYGPCVTGRNHGVWPFGVDLNELIVDDRNDVFGQPKNVVVVMRDLAAREGRQDPWALQFNYRFSASGSGTDFDLKQEGGTPASKLQAAVATGLVYYHRAGGDERIGWEHWKETPNFYNPFWRATLIATDVDERAANGRRRAQAAIDALSQHGLSTHANLLQRLRNQGFEGFQ